MEALFREDPDWVVGDVEGAELGHEPPAVRGQGLEGVVGQVEGPGEARLSMFLVQNIFKYFFIFCLCVFLLQYNDPNWTSMTPTGPIFFFSNCFSTVLRMTLRLVFAFAMRRYCKYSVSH